MALALARAVCELGAEDLNPYRLIQKRSPKFSWRPHNYFTPDMLLKFPA